LPRLAICCIHAALSCDSRPTEEVTSRETTAAIDTHRADAQSGLG
jgi:hypothetical protein